MTDQVKLHVGYIGKTREGKRVEFTQHDPTDNMFKSKDGLWYYENGLHMFSGGHGRYDIIGPWTEDTVTEGSGCVMCDLDVCDTNEYETGVWYGWNGGECPVDGNTRGDLTYADGTVYVNAPFGVYDWDEPLMFRIVTPYVEPEPKLECWALLDDDGDLLLCQTKEYAIASKKSWGGTIHRMIEADDQ